MAIPKYDEMYKEVLEVLKDCEPHKLSYIRDRVAQLLKITESERKVLLPSGKQSVFNNRANWACTYLKKAGLIEYVSRGVLKISPSGLDVLKESPDVIDNKYLSQFPSFVEFTSIDRNTKDEKNISNNMLSPSQTPQDTLDEAYAKINSTLVDDVLSEVMNQSPIFFEHLVVKLLTKMGYGGTLENAGIVTKASGDEGIDGIIKEDKLGFDKIYIQAKRWDLESTVSRPEIQKFVGALAGQGAGKGLFITTAKFSQGAKDFATQQHATKIVLIDGEKLAQLMIEYNVGVSVEATYEIKRIDSDFFDDDLN